MSGIWIVLSTCHVGSFFSARHCFDSYSSKQVFARLVAWCALLWAVTLPAFVWLFLFQNGQQAMTEWAAWCWCLPKQQMCFTSLTCTEGSGFLLSHFTFFFKIIHVLNIERGWKMTQEKVSPLFLTIKIYIQLLSVKSVKVLCSHCMGFLVQSVWWGVWDGCSCG